jgi:hypothetical protein
MMDRDARLWAIALAGVLTCLPLPASAVEKIPVSVRQLRSGTGEHLIFSVRNDSPDTMIAWDFRIELLYSNGDVGHSSRFSCLDLTADEREEFQCGIKPGERKEFLFRVSARDDGPPRVTSAAMVAAVFDHGSKEKWMGDRRGLDRLVKDFSGSPEVWAEILAILENTAEPSSSPEALQLIHDRLESVGPSHYVTRRLQSRLRRQMHLRSEGRALQRDEELLRTMTDQARSGSARAPEPDP